MQAHTMKSINFIQGINVLDGKITFDGLDLNENISLANQVDSLREDMLQIEYGERFTLDVGWQPDFDPSGYFIVRVILDEDWEEPLFEGKCHTLPELKKIIESSAALIHEKMKIKDLPYRDVEYDEFDYPQEE